METFRNYDPNTIDSIPSHSLVLMDLIFDKCLSDSSKMLSEACIIKKYYGWDMWLGHISKISCMFFLTIFIVDECPLTQFFSHRILSYNFVQRRNNNTLNAINAELQQLAPQRQMLPNATY